MHTSLSAAPKDFLNREYEKKSTFRESTGSSESTETKVSAPSDGSTRKR
jgi:hypothetical protein